MQCVVNTLFLTLEQVFVRIKSLSVYRPAFMLTGEFLHEHFVPPLEIASLSQKEESLWLSALASYSV